ncbi:hypothetical protein BCR41DRAFT_344874 [Lobosporangium transversale]|uniref:Uncharacterized protein n=1 Tax=Lobosporangium transversale TaxID=64571 RepID=A0A1Y2H101_9FUNG|nr:hypothetical protein BCR41DRAFT_344874 [Lobosporangium transversale]ORZ28230.1 hypothetical protein BCR41DRAFT_344874 [Lobosporangium transversale]|eukprot:XP_021885915.1 hypothetical protein BCR41DRAFT_344874 [Lobosporangium transversale]
MMDAHAPKSPEILIKRRISSSAILTIPMSPPRLAQIWTRKYVQRLSIAIIPNTRKLHRPVEPLLLIAAYNLQIKTISMNVIMYAKSRKGLASFSFTNCCERVKKESSPKLDMNAWDAASLLFRLARLLALGAFAGFGGLLTMMKRKGKR